MSVRNAKSSIIFLPKYLSYMLPKIIFVPRRNSSMKRCIISVPLAASSRPYAFLLSQTFLSLTNLN